MAGPHSVPPPPEIRHLGDIAAAMLDRVPHALALVQGDDQRRLIGTCAAVLGDLADEPGDRPLHGASWSTEIDAAIVASRAASKPGVSGRSRVVMQPSAG